MLLATCLDFVAVDCLDGPAGAAAAEGPLPLKSMKGAEAVGTFDSDSSSVRRNFEDGPATGSSRERFFDMSLRGTEADCSGSAGRDMAFRGVKPRGRAGAEDRFVVVGRDILDVAGFDADANGGSSTGRLLDGPTAGS